MANDDPLNAFLSNAAGGPSAEDDPQKGDMLSGLLQGMAGGSGPDSDTGDDSLGGLMAGLLGGSPDIGSAGPAGGMGDLLGTLLGGLGGSPDIGSPGSAGGVGDLVGALFGGMSGQGTGSGGLGDLLGTALGTGASQATLLAPLADSISVKAGIPRELAMLGLTFLLTKLTSSQEGGGAGGRGLSLDDMDLSSDNMAAEFAAEAGIDKKTAGKTLDALVLALSSGSQ